MSINVVLMAGSGKRFTDAGYNQSKPLIPVSGKPMIVQAVKSMPNTDKWVFVVRKEHLEEKEVIDTLKSVGENVEIIVDDNPIGQLNSCLVAKEKYLNEDKMFVGACDLGMVYDKMEFDQKMKETGADMVVFSFTRQPNLTRNPQAWGWLKQDDDNMISGVSVKVPISDDPFNDFAITGSFAFKNGELFTELADELISRGITVKGEYYIDSLIEIAVEKGYKVLSYPVKYIGWGVPQDYEEYNYWERVFVTKEEDEVSAKEKAEFEFWKEFFDNESF